MQAVAFTGKARAQATMLCPLFTSFQFAMKMQPLALMNILIWLVFFSKHACTEGYDLC